MRVSAESEDSAISAYRDPRDLKKCAARMQPSFDNYQQSFKSSARSLPDIAEEPGQDQDVPCQCYRLIEHPRLHQDDLKRASSNASKEPYRTSLMAQHHDCTLDVSSTGTHARRTAKFILLFAVVGVVLMLILSMAYIVVSLSYTQANLLQRVTVLEHRLAEIDEACDCKRTVEGESGQKDVTKGEKRNNKFAFLMTQGHAKLLEGDLNSKSEGDSDLHDDLNEILETATRGIHPKVLIGLEEARSTASSQARNLVGHDPAPVDTSRAPQERMPVVSQRIESAGRYKRGGKRKGGNGPQRARAGMQPVKSEKHNATEIRGVHFQANLNRTTAIGVAGWVPHWVLSSSLRDMESPEFTAELQNEFRLSPRGNVTVRTPGLYYVYSQMMYYDPHEYIGHSIVVNGVETFTCIAPISGQNEKYKTCFIGGLVHIPARAKVGIKMLYTPRRVCLFEDTSYFGMFRVS